MDNSHIHPELKNIGTNGSIFIKSKNSKLSPLMEHMTHASLNTLVGTLREVVTRREHRGCFRGGIHVLFLAFSLWMFLKMYQVMYL